MVVEETQVNEILDVLLNDPVVMQITKAVRKNAALSEIIGSQHTTQAFSCANDLALAFQGKLECVVDSVDERVREAKEKYGDLILKCGITDEDLIKLFAKVWIYSRLTNPVSELLEEVISMMEGTEKSAIFASGLGAIDAAVRQFTPAASAGENGEYCKGGKVFVVGSIYGGTYAQLMDLCKETGRQFEHLPISDFLQQGLPDDTDMVLFETCNNPTLRIVPIGKIVEEAKRVGALTLCDNTFTPLIVRPCDLGVDLSVTSMTKYYNGGSEDLGGCVSGKAELVDQFSDLHVGRRMLGGAIMAPRVAHEFLNNLKDLPERLVYATDNARNVSEVAREFGFRAELADDFASYDDVKVDGLPGVMNGMVVLRLESAEMAHAFVDSMVAEGMGECAVSLGAVKTYYSIPAETTHSEMPEEERSKIGISPGLVRVSCGIEPGLAEAVRRVLSGFRNA